jgi:hypothetical protein
MFTYLRIAVRGKLPGVQLHETRLLPRESVHDSLRSCLLDRLRR